MGPEILFFGVAFAGLIALPLVVIASLSKETRWYGLPVLVLAGAAGAYVAWDRDVAGFDAWYVTFPTIFIVALAPLGLVALLVALVVWALKRVAAKFATKEAS